MVHVKDDRLMPSDDLKDRIRFSFESGHIWLGEQRMLLMHSAASGSMRKELVETLGVEHAKGIMMRTGFQAGVADARLAKKLRPEASELDQFMVGPELHQLEGLVSVKVNQIEIDVLKKRFYMELVWKDSYESEAHKKAYGIATDPVCWMEVGYASGYSSEFTGQSILFVEQACNGCGADDCVVIGKPVDEWENSEEWTKYYESESIVDKILNLRDEVVNLRSSIKNINNEQQDIVGESKSFHSAFALLQKATQGPVTVLLLGETGVGKELFARSLHRKSARSEKNFIAINCAAIPEDLLESELFGVEKGAYTGAHESRKGRFERADGGTLFLDEIGDLTYSAQAKLLRVLQEGELERIGGTKVISVDVRVVAATHTNLIDKVEAGDFRRDLFYRLNVYPIVIPPLRERRGDIAMLVENFVDQYKVKYEKDIKGVTEHALLQLERYEWPGNIRELENVIERGVLLCENGGFIELEHLFAMIGVDEKSDGIINENGKLKTLKKGEHNQFVEMFFDAKNNLFDIEEAILKEAVKRSNGNLSGAARQLGMSRPQLAYRLGKIEEGNQ